MATVDTDGADADILTRVIRPDLADFTPAVARAILALDFAPADRERMLELAVKNQDGALFAAERRQLDGYRRVGRLLELLSAKARLSLRRRGRAAVRGTVRPGAASG